MKKFFYIFLVILKNVNKYGYYNIFKIIFFEIIYNIKYFDFKSNFYEDNKTNTYLETRKLKFYNTPYSPTPYYYLFLINRLFKEKKFFNYVFLDFGCGAGRVLFFFKKKFFKLIGIDLNKDYKKFFDKEKIIFKNLNLRKKSTFNYVKKIKKNKCFYFYEPFDKHLVMKYIKNMKTNDYVVIINLNIILKKNFSEIFKKKIKKKKILIYKKN